jgi:putative membrane protein
MYDGHMMWGGGWFMMLLWTALLVIAIVWIVRALQTKNANNGTHQSTETALDIAKKRYARGEISKEEYEAIKKDLL